MTLNFNIKAILPPPKRNRMNGGHVDISCSKRALCFKECAGNVGYFEDDHSFIFTSWRTFTFRPEDKETSRIIIQCLNIALDNIETVLLRCKLRCNCAKLSFR